MMREDASWRNMLPIQPPVQIERVVTTGGCSCVGDEVRRAVIRDEFQVIQQHGVTMGMLWDVCIALLDSEPESWASVQWHSFGTESEYEEFDGIDETGGFEDPDGLRETVEYKGEYRVVDVKRNMVTLRLQHSTSCYCFPKTPCGLMIGRFDEKIMEFEDESPKLVL
jgi:hypothetical protein